MYAEVAPSETAASALMGRKGVVISGGPSSVYEPGSPTIDAGYRGEVKVALINLDQTTPIVVHRGDRIAQLLVQRVGQQGLLPR